MFVGLSGHCVKSAQIQSFLWFVFSRIRADNGEILRIFPYSVWSRENPDQKKLRISFGHFSRSGGFCCANNTKLHYWSTMNFISPFHPRVAFHIETSHLICNANQMTGSCIECNSGLKGIDGLYSHVYILWNFKLRWLY